MLLVPFLKRCWLRIIGTPPQGVLAVGAVAVLAGCSMVSLGYNRLPDLGLLWLNRQLPLTDAQSAQARTDMAALLAWHRRTQLPATADLLRRWQDLATGDLSAADTCSEWAQVRGLLDTITQQALPAMARLASGTTPAQLAELQRTQRKGNDEFREAHAPQARRGWFTPANAATENSAQASRLSAQAGLDKRLDTLRDRYSQLYGPLSDAQAALLRERLQTSPFQPERTLAERERRQTELLGVLQSLQTPQEAGQAQALVRAWLTGWSASPTPGYAAYAQQLTRDGCAQLAALHRTTTPEQRAHAVRTLKGYEQDLRALAQH